MAPPLPYREFVALVKRHGCTIVRNGSHGKIQKDGMTLCTFAVSHGKNTKGEDVKPIYVKHLMQAIGGLTHD